MKVSIVTPSFNQAQFLAKTIESVVTQEGDFYLEYLVMDGGSTDGSVNLLRQTEKKLKNHPRISFYWQSKKDKGQSDAINQGLKKASGDIVAYLNSDDYYEQGALQKIVKAFNRHHGIWLTGFCHVVNEHDQIIQKSITAYKNWWLNHYSYTALLVLNYVCQPATFWRSEVMKEAGFFNEDLHYTMDYDFWLRLGEISSPIIVDDYLANFRIHQTSKGKQQFVKQFDQDLQVSRQYASNLFWPALHQIHNWLIVSVYRVIK